MKIKPALPVWPFNSQFSILHSPLLKSLCDFNNLFSGHLYLLLSDGLLHASDSFGGAHEGFVGDGGVDVAVGL